MGGSKKRQRALGAFIITSIQDRERERVTSVAIMTTESSPLVDASFIIDSHFRPAVVRNPATGHLEPQCRTAAKLLDLNTKQSHMFIAEPYYSERKRHLASHPTEIIAFKCMDGRLNLDLITGLPPGVVTGYRNIAGRFDVGWPKLREQLAQHVADATNRGHRMIALCTYHFSDGCRERGCRGMDFDTVAARELAASLAVQFRDVFAGGSRATVFPLVVGIETDSEGLILHSEAECGPGETVSITAYAAETPDATTLRAAVRNLLPRLDAQLLDDLMPVLLGNAKHIYTRRQEHIPIIDLDHRETVIAIGSGFGWMHTPNKALVIAPFDHNWTSAAATAASVITKNIANNAVDPTHGIVLALCTSCTGEPGGWRWKMAEMTSRYLARAAQQAIMEQSQLLATTVVYVLAGVVEKESMRMHLVE